ncbi:cyclophilin-like fold protein [Lacrimispora brassicae]
MRIKKFSAAVIFTCLCMLFSTTAFAANHFEDVVSGAWYYDQVTSAVEKGYMSGVGENRFMPDAPMTRAMLVQILSNFTEGYDAAQYQGNSRFSDVKVGAWYASAVNWAAEQKIVAGTSDITFSPDRSITRQEMAVMLYNYAKVLSVDVTHTEDRLSSYSDRASVAPWAVNALRWAVDRGVISGTSASTLSPLSTATRAQIAAAMIKAEDVLRTVNSQNPEKGEEDMQITIKSNGNSIVFRLNDSQAAKDLYAQLPLTIQVQNYSTNEKIFYPPETLDITNATEASGMLGNLAYYEPWGNVVMFYKPFTPTPGGRLYELGQVVSGSEHIQNLAGSIEISKE